MKLKQMRPQDVPLEKILEAMELSGKWVVKKLKGNPKTGPFSEAVLTEKAAKFFPKLAYQKWVSGDWEWKDSLDLTSQFIRIIRSEMTMFDIISTNVVAKPMLIPLMADVVVAKVGHMPSISTHVGFSLIRPFFIICVAFIFL